MSAGHLDALLNLLRGRDLHHRVMVTAFGATQRDVRCPVTTSGRCCTRFAGPVKLSYDPYGVLLAADVHDGTGGFLSRFERSQLEPRADADPFGAGSAVTGPEGGAPVMTPGGRLSLTCPIE